MAMDFFLHIDGVPGESKDAKHQDWLDVFAWSWGESHSAIASPAGGGAGKANFQDVTVTTPISKASPALFLACAAGKHFKQAKLTGRHRGGAPDDFLTWTFSDVLVTSFQTGASEGQDTIVENVSLNFSKVAVSYKGQKADGSLDAPVTAGWDIKKNTKV
jgi:type VI secretion system secreted protein Hcp